MPNKNYISNWEKRKNKIALEVLEKLFHKYLQRCYDNGRTVEEIKIPEEFSILLNQHFDTLATINVFDSDFGLLRIIYI